MSGAIPNKREEEGIMQFADKKGWLILASQSHLQYLASSLENIPLPSKTYSVVDKM